MKTSITDALTAMFGWKWSSEPSRAVPSRVRPHSGKAKRSKPCRAVPCSGKAPLLLVNSHQLLTHHWYNVLWFISSSCIRKRVRVEMAVLSWTMSLIML